MEKIIIDKEKLFYDCNMLFSMPETDFDLEGTSDYVKKSLLDMGIDSQNCGKCGVTATVGNGDKCILLRADMDAIELEGKGAFHGCGHHMHTAMLLGAARFLKDREYELKNTVRLMFQPAEEILEGAIDMISSGILHNPKPHAAFMLHVATGVDIPTGTLIFPAEGIIAPGADYFEITISGKGCHGSQPEKGVDPIVTGAQLTLALSNIQARELGAKEKAVLTIGSFRGGSASNAIPQKVTLGGTLRAYSDKTREFVKKRLEEITENICRAMRSEGRTVYTRGCPPFICDGEVRSKAFELCKEAFGKDKIIDASHLTASDSGAGSEDFAYVSQKIPSLMVSLAAGLKADGYIYPLHHPEVTFDKNALPVGSEFLAYIAMNY